jgi:hypothetical protein
MTKLPNWKPDSQLLGPYHQKSTMPAIKALEAKPTHRPGAISKAPTPTIHGTD